MAAPFTPFDNKGNINTNVIEDLANLYVKNGVTGAFIAGTTGECPSLSFDEKVTLIEAWSSCAGKKLDLVFMLGSNRQREMIRLAKLCAKNKFVGTSILCPYYFKAATVNDLVNYCVPIAKAAPKLDFYYYHIPALSRSDYPMAEFVQIADRKIPNLGGIKYSHNNLMDFQKCTTYKPKKYNILWGIDEALIMGLTGGAAGAIGSTYNYAAPLYHKIIKAHKKGELKKAQQLQQQSIAMVDVLVKYGGINAGKAFMKFIGIDCGWCRAPLKPLSKSQLKAMRKDLEKIGFFQFCSKT